MTDQILNTIFSQPSLPGIALAAIAVWFILSGLGTILDRCHWFKPWMRIWIGLILLCTSLFLPLIVLHVVAGFR